MTDPNTEAPDIAGLVERLRGMFTNTDLALFNEAARALEALQAERKELEAIFDLRWNADMRAIKDWQEITGQELTMPDHADLCVFLMGLVETGEKTNENLNATIASLREALEEAKSEAYRCADVQGGGLYRTQGFGKIHTIAAQALAREHPDNGTTEEESSR